MSELPHRAQIGILAIVSVAVGVVTLLSDRQDGSSVNTDIAFYYVESYSTSSAAGSRYLWSDAPIVLAASA